MESEPVTRRRPARPSAALLALALACGGCAAAAVGVGAGAGVAAGVASAQSGKSAGEIVDDSILAARVKAELLKSPVVRGLNIDVDVDLGVVYLNGVATSRREVEEAVRLARSVKGVRQVKNNLIVR
ncbi:MAG: BON domain-containing protein [Nitrospirae bacterium]|nr:MAG: BON domain-containing protein [Nitrospirota bacterium]